MINSKEIKLKLAGAKAKIVYHEFIGAKCKTLIIDLVPAREVLTTSSLWDQQAFRQVETIGNHYTPPQLWERAHQDEGREFFIALCHNLGYDPEKIAMLATGVDMDKLEIKYEEFRDYKVCCIATAGVSSNALRIGVDAGGNYEIDGKFQRLGTINIILMTNASLTRAAMAGALITITEAKVIALQDLDIRSSYNPKNQASGTGTDNVMVVPGFGVRVHYVGGHSKLGELIAKTVTSAVKEAILNSMSQK